MQLKSTANLMEELLQTSRVEDFLQHNENQFVDMPLSRQLETLLEDAGISEETVDIVCEDNNKYRLEFFLLELLGIQK